MNLRPLLLLALLPAPLFAQWNQHAGDAQHTGITTVPSLSLDSIRWSTPVDENTLGDPIYIHYGSPVATAANTIVVPVRAAGGAFRLDARNGADGSLLWSSPTDFLTAPSNGSWIPSLSPAITPSGALYYQGIGGTVYKVADPNATSVAPVQLSFLPDYAANKAAYDTSVFISTPITADAAGNIYFGYETTASAPGGLTSGIARIAPDGSATHISADLASGAIGGTTGFRVGTNSAPALSLDGTKLYVALTNTVSGSPVLSALSTTTLTHLQHTILSGFINDAATSSPTVAPDGDVFFGTLYGYHYRGQLEHFSADLSQSFTQGSFGWDETVSIVPSYLVPSYHGSSTYLIFSKYNDYKEASGSGVNRLAILDPDDTQIDPVTGQPVMKEVLTIAGVTPDPELPAVREWCINTAVVDPATHSILANSEDGKFYRWDLWTNTFTQVIELQAIGVGEAYTPTFIGPDGTAYAINKATLFALVPEPGSAALLACGLALLSRSRRR